MLVAPLFLLFVNIKSNPIRKEHALNSYRNGEKPRFYMLEFDDKTKMENDLLDSFIIDFKYFFTADMSQFNENNYVATVAHFYRESISHNFANYLSRIGIPVSKKDEDEDEILA